MSDSDPEILERPALHPVATILRGRGFVPLPRLWVRSEDMPTIHMIAGQYREEVIRITEDAAGFAMSIALRHVAKIRIISVALHCIAGVAKRLKIADVVRSAMLAWDDVIDFERALFCRHATEFTTEFRALQYLVFQSPGEHAARFSPVIPDPLATRRQVVIDLYFAERDQFLDFRMGKIVDTLERESGYARRLAQ